jgi:hypothetical protein
MLKGLRNVILVSAWHLLVLPTLFEYVAIAHTGFAYK